MIIKRESNGVLLSAHTLDNVVTDDQGYVSHNDFYGCIWEDRPDGSPCYQTSNGIWTRYVDDKRHCITGPAHYNGIYNYHLWFYKDIDIALCIKEYCKDNDLDPYNIHENDFILFLLTWEDRFEQKP